jgi:alanyl-tRNA synthetase
MTERLYYTDAYLRRFEARVVERADDGRRIYLDRTALYPTSGGQPHDLGRLAGIPVVDVIDEDDRVDHVLEAPLNQSEVVGEIDWERRFDLMQQHTGQHLLSAIFADTFGYQTLSVHFGDEMSTLDLDVAAVGAETLRQAEARANAIIAENRPVHVTFEDASSAAGLRKPSDRGGTLRVVGIEDIDRSACGGTHVARTGEIGVLLLRRQEKIRKATRIEFLCGLRAARRARADFEALAGMANALSASIDELPALVASQNVQFREADQRRRRAENELASFRAREQWESVAPDESGLRRIVHAVESGALEDWRSFAIACSTLSKATCLIAIRESRALMFAASEDSGVDAGGRLKTLLAEFGGRGGGSPRLAQGSLPDAEAFRGAVARLTT